MPKFAKPVFQGWILNQKCTGSTLTSDSTGCYNRWKEENCRERRKVENCREYIKVENCREVRSLPKIQMQKVAAAAIYRSKWPLQIKPDFTFNLTSFPILDLTSSISFQFSDFAKNSIGLSSWCGRRTDRTYNTAHYWKYFIFRNHHCHLTLCRWIKNPSTKLKIYLK